MRESDRHLTTFITPFGRFPYTRAPQGFVSSGDGYNRCFSAILSGFDRKERCVDDTVFYDSELDCHWWRTIDFLSKFGKAGIIINPKKFQFCQSQLILQVSEFQMNAQNLYQSTWTQFGNSQHRSLPQIYGAGLAK